MTGSSIDIASIFPLNRFNSYLPLVTENTADSGDWFANSLILTCAETTDPKMDIRRIKIFYISP